MSNDLDATNSIDGRNMFWDIPHPISEEPQPLPVEVMNYKNTDRMPTKNSSTNEADVSPRQHRKGWRKPRGMPKRPMSSYNLFFQLERERLVNDEEERVFSAEDIDRIAMIQKQKDLSCHKRKHRKSHGKISFAKLARVIADKWKALDTASKAAFYERAALEKDKYKAAVDEWARTNKDSRSITSSPRPINIDQLIESPPSSDEQYIQNQTTTSSPEVAQELWDTMNRQAVMDQMMINGIMDGSWGERIPDCNPIGYADEQYRATSLDRIRNLRNLQSLTRTQLQPRFVPTNIGYMEHNQHYNMRDNSTCGFQPTKINNIKFSPSSAADNIYAHHQEFTSPSFVNYELSPENRSGYVNIDMNHNVHSIRNHAKLTRRRTFALGEKNLSEPTIKNQRTLLSGYRHQSVPSMYHSRYDYSNNEELAGLPLESLVEVHPESYISSYMYNEHCGIDDMRRPPPCQQRRSTFSGGYIEDKECHDHMMVGYNSPTRITDQYHLTEPQEEEIFEKEQNKFPPVEVIAFRRESRTHEAYRQGPDFAGTNVYTNPSSSSPYDHDNVLGSYVANHHFGKGTKYPCLNSDEEKAAIDLISLTGHTKKSVYMKNVVDDEKLYCYNQTDNNPITNHDDNNHNNNMSSSLTNDEDHRDTSESNSDVPVMNYDDASYLAKRWAV
jgi:hypothetical protein